MKNGRPSPAPRDRSHPSMLQQTEEQRCDFFCPTDQSRTFNRHSLQQLIDPWTSRIYHYTRTRKMSFFINDKFNPSDTIFVTGAYVTISAPCSRRKRILYHQPLGKFDLRIEVSRRSEQTFGIQSGDCSRVSASERFDAAATTCHAKVSHTQSFRREQSYARVCSVCKLES